MTTRTLRRNDSSIPGGNLSRVGYDGHGSTRASTSSTAAITDTYDYDAFGNIVHSTAIGIPPGGTTVTATPNEFLFAGEQFDSDLGLYYNRARYLNVSTGRFWTMETLIKKVGG